MSGVVAPEAIQALVPHKGAMCLWDEVLAWDADSIHLGTARHRDIEHPLRSHGCLRAIHLCEYGAQAMAVHGGLRSGGGAAPGMLVSLRAVELAVDRIDDLPGAIECQAQLLVDGDTGWQYQFRIRHGSEVLAEGRAAVMLQPAQAGTPTMGQASPPEGAP